MENTGNINWKKAKSAGINFAIIRVGYRGYGTEGRIVLDENFDSHAAGAIAAGIPIGVYFFSEAVDEMEAIEEANMVIEMIDKLEQYNLINHKAEVINIVIPLDKLINLYKGEEISIKNGSEQLNLDKKAIKNKQLRLYFLDNLTVGTEEL